MRSGSSRASPSSSPPRETSSQSVPGASVERLTPIFRGLREHGLITADETSAGTSYALSESGRATVETLRAARSERITELLADWAPETHPEVRRIIDELSRSLAQEAPGRAVAVPA